MNNNESKDIIRNYSGTLLSDLKSYLMTLDERTSAQPWNEEIQKIFDGEQEIKDKYKNKYTAEALENAINEFKLEAVNEAIKRLKSSDKSIKQLAEHTLHNTKKREVEILKKLEPQTELGLQRHNNLISSIQNEIDVILASRPITNTSLDELFERADFDEDFAKALLHVRGSVLKHINDNNRNVVGAATLVNNYTAKFEDLEKKILPVDHKVLIHMRRQAEIFNRFSGHTSTFMFFVGKL